VDDQKRETEAEAPPKDSVGPVADPVREPQATGDPAKPDADAVAEDSAGADLVEQDLDELLSARKERDEYLELAQRTKADFENYRRRAAHEASEAERRGRAGLVRELVPVLDNLERALRTAGIDPEGEETGADGAALAHGVLLVYRELRATVERAGVETYDPEGEAFDPEWHEALSTRPADGASPGTVVQTVEKGYRLGDLVLRPARVIVSE
jgi:molecular chaperone GrpE